jgi:hypothetical protein
MKATILVGDVLSRLKDIPDGSVQTCVTSPPSNAHTIKQFRLLIANLHRCGQSFRPASRANVASAFSNTRLRTLTFERPECKEILSLHLFDSQERQEAFSTAESSRIGDGPRVKRPAVLCAWLRDVDRAAKRLFEKVNNFRRHLAQGDSLRIGSLRGVFDDALRVGASLHSNSSVRVNRTGKIR